MKMPNKQSLLLLWLTAIVFAQSDKGGNNQQQSTPDDKSDCKTYPCLNGGTCEEDYYDYDYGPSCTCPPAFTGDRCEKPLNTQGTEEPQKTGVPEGNVCTPECQNGGSCIEAKGSLYCSCGPEFTGQSCETRIESPCSSNPCLNGGTCASGPSGYTCECPSIYTGERCENGSPCSNNPCMNGGTCVERSPTSYLCKCENGFMGTNCHIGDKCASNPCFNGGTCTSTMTSYSCQCRERYIGRRCGSLDTCKPNPCRNGGTCMNAVGYGGFGCACRAGYTGATCEIPYGQQTQYTQGPIIVTDITGTPEQEKEGTCNIELFSFFIQKELALTCTLDFECPGEEKCCPYFDSGNFCTITIETFFEEYMYYIIGVGIGLALLLAIICGCCYACCCRSSYATVTPVGVCPKGYVF